MGDSSKGKDGGELKSGSGDADGGGGGGGGSSEEDTDEGEEVGVNGCRLRGVGIRGLLKKPSREVGNVVESFGGWTGG